jgi:hypothetical protein
MRKTVLLLGIAAFFAANPAWQMAAAACEGEQIIFEDKFADDAGGWPLRDTVEVKDGAFIFKLPPDDMQSNLNVTFTVKDADKFWIARKQDGKWLGTIAANVDSSAINKGPGAANTLRVKTSGNSVTFYINGTKVRNLRGQAPKGDWRFGLSGDNFDKQKDAKVMFKTVKVTN